MSGKTSDVIKKPDCDIAKDKLQDSILLTKVESEELDCTRVNHLSSENRPGKLSDSDTTFMEFVVTKGLRMEPEAKKNIRRKKWLYLYFRDPKYPQCSRCHDN